MFIRTARRTNRHFVGVEHIRLVWRAGSRPPSPTTSLPAAAKFADNRRTLYNYKTYYNCDN